LKVANPGKILEILSEYSHHKISAQLTTEVYVKAGNNYKKLLMKVNGIP